MASCPRTRAPRRCRRSCRHCGRRSCGEEARPHRRRQPDHPRGRALGEAGFDVETRSGVEEVGDKGATGFDLILMDVQMPQLFGDDVARRLATPIYLFLTLPPTELAIRTRDARLDGLISKDLGMANLVGEVRRILGH